MAVNKLEIIECAIEQLDKKEPEMIKNMLIQFLKENLQAPKAKKNSSFPQEHPLWSNVSIYTILLMK